MKRGYKHDKTRGCRGSKSNEAKEVRLNLGILSNIDKVEYILYRDWLVLREHKTDNGIMQLSEAGKYLNISIQQVHEIVKRGHGTYWKECKGKRKYIRLYNEKHIIRRLGIKQKKVKVVWVKYCLHSLSDFNNAVIDIYAELKNAGKYNKETQEHIINVKPNKYDLIKGRAETKIIKLSGKSYKRIANKSGFSYSKVSKRLAKHKGKKKRFQAVQIGKRSSFNSAGQAVTYLKDLQNNIGSDYPEWIVNNGKQGLIIKRQSKGQYVIARRLSNEFQQSTVIRFYKVHCPNIRIGLEVSNENKGDRQRLYKTMQDRL